MAFKRSFSQSDINERKKSKKEPAFNSFLRGYQTTKELGTSIFGDKIAEKKAQKKYKRDKTLWENIEARGTHVVDQITVVDGVEKRTYKPKKTLLEQQQEKEKLDQSKLQTDLSRQKQEQGALNIQKTQQGLEEGEIELEQKKQEREKIIVGDPTLTKEERKTANDLGKRYDAQSKEFFKVRDSFSRVKASAINPSAAGDLALIFNYMKILDPGSVVRESEFANAAASGSLGQRWTAIGMKLISGERLSKAIRADFVDRANKLFESQYKIHETRIKKFSGFASQQGIDPKNIIGESFLKQQQTPEDQEALQWAKANPNDPRAVQIIQSQGG